MAHGEMLETTVKLLLYYDMKAHDMCYSSLIVLPRDGRLGDQKKRVLCGMIFKFVKKGRELF